MFRLFFKIIFLIPLLIGCAARATPPMAPAPANVTTSAVFVAPDAGLTPVVSAVNSAVKSLRVQAHWLAEKEILDALKAARGRGVDVRVLYENQPLGANASNRGAVNALNAAGVTTRASYPAFKLAHANYVVVDERLALVLTFDALRAASVDVRGFGVRVTEPAQIAELIVVFESDWKRAASAPTQPSFAWSAVNARARLVALIESARQSLDLECQDLKDDALTARVMDAIQRGVLVRIVASPAEDGETPAWLHPLAQAGAKTRLVKTPYIQGTLILADNARAFVGATRLTTLALDTHRDLGVVLDDPASVGMVATTFAYDWNIGK